MLTRRPYEAIYIGDDTRIRVLGFDEDGAVRLRIEAPAGDDLPARAVPVTGVEPGWRLSLREGESLHVGPSRVMVQSIRGSAVRLGVDAPEGRRVLRGELFMERAPTVKLVGSSGPRSDITATLTLRGEKRASLLITGPSFWSPPPLLVDRIEAWASEKLGNSFKYAAARDTSTTPRGELATDRGKLAEVWLLRREDAKREAVGQ